MVRRSMIAAAAALLLAAAVQLQIVRERLGPLPVQGGSEEVIHVRSPQAARRIALSFDSLAADVYWIRAIQYYGATKRSTDAGKDYDQLYPMLDLTTSLDPHFRAAYRFGAIFLSEAFPDGPGRPDLAIDLLRKGLRAEPDRWEYAQDIGFVHYWWRRDYRAASEWFIRASAIPTAPPWLKPLAAVVLAEGGNIASSRRLWNDVLGNAEDGWLQSAARRRLRQLDALEQLERLVAIIRQHASRTGSSPRSWQDLVRAGSLDRVPVDPDGYEYVFDGARGVIGLDPRSPLNPLPIEMLAVPDAPERT